MIRESKKVEFLAPLPVSRIWGVGKSAQAVLRDLGVQTIGDLRKLPLDLLKTRFGKAAKSLHDLSRGEDEREVVPDAKAKSIGSEVTFENDIADSEALMAILLELSEDVGQRLREEGLHCRTITLKARYPDFKTITRRTTLTEPTGATAQIYKEACQILKAKVPLHEKSLRLIGITVSGLHRGGVQLPLFDRQARVKAARLDETVDKIRKKMGPDSLKRGRLL